MHACFKIMQHIHIHQTIDVQVGNICPRLDAFLVHRDNQTGITDSAADQTDIENNIFHKAVMCPAYAFLDIRFSSGSGRIMPGFYAIINLAGIHQHQTLSAQHIGDCLFSIGQLIDCPRIKGDMQIIPGRDDKALHQRSNQLTIRQGGEKNQPCLCILYGDMAVDNVKGRRQCRADFLQPLIQILHQDFARNTSAARKANRMALVIPAAVKSNIPSKIPMTPSLCAFASAP